MTVPARSELTRWHIAAFVTWLALAAGGLGALVTYSSAAGRSASAPSTWPAKSAIARAPGLPTLLLFAHPKCPCTRATLDELEVVMDRVQGIAEARVVFVKPLSVEPGWEETDLVRRARAMPGVTVSIDVGGEEARRFGSQTSGQALLYDARGSLLFAGGLTSARGHAGDNASRRAVLALLGADAPPTPAPGAGASHETPHSSVFGCPLDDPHAREEVAREGEEDPR